MTTVTPALVANNEIRKLTGAGTFRGLYLYNSNVNYYHNTVYHAGTGACYCMYVDAQSATYTVNVKNNIFAAQSTNATNYPIYGSTAAKITTIASIDYNDYYGKSYVQTKQLFLHGKQR